MGASWVRNRQTLHTGLDISSLKKYDFNKTLSCLEIIFLPDKSGLKRPKVKGLNITLTQMVEYLFNNPQMVA